MRDYENDAQFTIRLPSKMKETVFELAKKKDMEGVAWIRQAIKEKIAREKGVTTSTSSNCLTREEVLNMINTAISQASLNQINTGDNSKLSLKVGK